MATRNGRDEKTEIKQCIYLLYGLSEFQAGNLLDLLTLNKSGRLSQGKVIVTLKYVVIVYNKV
ncbi:hypothetical protein COF80_11440 [Bacillus toyonensis]|nr:hypothetical protein COF80_11440 [Bacillus toyonensis]